MRTQFDQADLQRALERLVSAIANTFPTDQPLNIIGLRTRGDTLAGRLNDKLKARGFGKIGRGVLDITLYRDDLSGGGAKPMVRPTLINIDIDNHPAILVDDVLFTGRSIRSAMDALMDFGRPSIIRLAVLADRGGRELPIQADFVGIAIENVPVDHRVNVRLVEEDGRDEITVEPRA